jgi:hypothetical protein
MHTCSGAGPGKLDVVVQSCGRRLRVEFSSIIGAIAIRYEDHTGDWPDLARSHLAAGS